MHGEQKEFEYIFILYNMRIISLSEQDIFSNVKFINSTILDVINFQPHSPFVCVNILLCKVDPSLVSA